MTLTQIEHVLVVPTDCFRELGYFQGFCSQIDNYLDGLLASPEARFMPRDEMETDPSFKQLIPYCIIRHTDADGNVQLFQYTRGSGQGEARLHAKRSIGIGGHISSQDCSTPGLAEHSVYYDGMKRELDEELVIDTDYTERCVGLINDDQNAVGQVHLGVVHLLDVTTPDIHPRESDLASAGFRSLTEILAEIESYETWSQICLRALFQEQ